MKLIDLLSVLDENKDVVVNQYGEMISFYDGRNSIDECFNNREVIEVSADGDTIVIEIDTED